MKRAFIAVAIGLGLSALFFSINIAAAKAGTTNCVSRTSSHTWGTVPGFHQTVTATSQFCYNTKTGIITSRSTSVNADSLLCSIDDTYNQKLTGGTGNYYVEFKVGSHMSCPTNIPYVQVHRDDYMLIEFALTGSLPNPTIYYTVYGTSA